MTIIVMIIQILQNATMMEVIVVDLMSTNIIVFIVSAMFWTVQLHLIWLAMDTAMMNPILQIVIMMVGTAVELAQTKNIVLIVSAIQDHQWVEIVSTKCNYVHFFRCLQNMECWKHSFWITMTLFLHPAFCTPYLGYNFFSGSQYDPCFQNKNSGSRLTG